MFVSLEEREAGSSLLVDCASLICLQIKWKISSFIEAAVSISQHAKKQPACHSAFHVDSE